MKDVLIAGTGPTAVQYAVILQKYINANISICGRASISKRAKAFYEAANSENKVEVNVQNSSHLNVEGEATLTYLYKDYNEVNHVFDTLVLAVTADAYRSVIQSLPLKVIENIRQVILVSPTFGSHLIVKGQIEQLNSHSEIEVISFSTYLGDTRHIEDEKTSIVLTTGIKTHLYIGSTNKSSPTMNILISLFKQIGLSLTVTNNPLMAESRNSSLYVHPALFMNSIALNAIFEPTSIPIYVYKLFPEGPITMQLIREMRLMWQEMNTILEHLNITELNLLQFMTEENYPIREETMDKADIHHFESLPAIHQEYLLYVRYTAILIDPFSEPDESGRYFDFSGVPFKTIFRKDDGKLEVPRMPSEDYYRTKIIQGIGHSLQIETPMINRFIDRYEQQVKNYRETHRNEQFSQSFYKQDFAEDITFIQKYLKIKTEVRKVDINE
ncbi:staphylopine biosynthesis dehydrogenase [Mammaliicoccus stepanovicii]|uniref:staphylopine biosynthesis dehydrogenase n=1 Tax=Mammaliicoccus stepanovicii TaxID=643214 RepID=UPI003530F89F